MGPTRRASTSAITTIHEAEEEHTFSGPVMPHFTSVPRASRKSSIAAIFDDNRRRDDLLLKQTRPNLRNLWAKYNVPYVIGEDVTTPTQTFCEIALIIFSWCLVILFFPFSIALTLKIVQEYERAVIFRLGRLTTSSARGPGMCFILPCVDTVHLIDIRTVSFDVPPQEVLTRDSVTVAVDAVVYYRVFNPTVSVANVEHAQESTRLLAQTSLRNVLGTRLLSELLCDRGSVSNAMRECLDEATDNWGIKVERVEIKDVRLPKMLQRIMAAEAEAAREARAKVINDTNIFQCNIIIVFSLKIIASEGEFKASRALKEAADTLAQSPCALQLRYLQTLNGIATEQNSTIVFPLPIEILSFFQNSKTILKQSSSSTPANMSKKINPQTLTETLLSTAPMMKKT